MSRIMNDSATTSADKGFVRHVSRLGSHELTCYVVLLDRHLKNTPEYRGAEVSHVTSYP